MADGAHRDLNIWFFLGLFIASVLLLGWLLFPFLSIIVMAAVVAGIFNPLYLFIRRRVRPAVASLAVCILIFIVLFIPIAFFVGVLSREAYDLYLMGKDAVISDHVRKLVEGTWVLDRANLVLSQFGISISGIELNRIASEFGKVTGLFLYEQARSIASNMFMFLVNFFLMLLVIYFLLQDGKNLISFIVKLSPLPTEQNEKLIRKFRDIAGAILVGNGLGGLIQGVLGGLVFMLFGFKSPFLWGVIMGILAFLPIVGIGAVFLPAAVYLFLHERIAAGIFFIAFWILLSGGIDYYFKPKLVGSRVQMNTLLVFLAIMGGMNLFGILGVIYGPLVVTAFLTLADIYRASYQEGADASPGSTV
jgi:predicted PurR-regulated permease PerM